MDLRVAETVKALKFLDGHTWDHTCRFLQAQNAALEAIRREVELERKLGEVALPTHEAEAETDDLEMLECGCTMAGQRRPGRELGG